ncbi:carbohydrate-binding WSC domain-containing protein [Apiospora marii]|uniref:Carbohydrate-binding WSC domain-containing protein n=1 Tax=Apiospora marii TaxID=335849 RepID=A0ABR1R252_9PEZI
MFISVVSAVALSAGVALGCEIPAEAPSKNIPGGFSIQIQSPDFPAADGHYMNTWLWGGGDFHLFVSPAGNTTDTFTLVDGVITYPLDPIRRAVINGEYEPKDNTTKMFMTERGDPRGVFDVVYGCNPANDSLQLELVTPEQGTSGVKGNMGVRPFNGDLDFRWQPIGTTVSDPDRPWHKVTLVVRPTTSA